MQARQLLLRKGWQRSRLLTSEELMVRCDSSVHLSTQNEVARRPQRPRDVARRCAHVCDKRPRHRLEVRLEHIRLRGRYVYERRIDQDSACRHDHLITLITGKRKAF